MRFERQDSQFAEQFCFTAMVLLLFFYFSIARLINNQTSISGKRKGRLLLVFQVLQNTV